MREDISRNLMPTNMAMKTSKEIFRKALAVCGLVTLFQLSTGAAEPLRPPSVPLVACDPYFSIWSPADKLTDADTVHWTGKPHRLTSLVRIDGKPFRIMGTSPTNVPALPQKNLEVTPTRTIYTFEGEGVQLTFTFMTPSLPDDLMVYSRPVTYVTYDFKAMDGKDHEVAAYFDASAALAVNQPSQEVVFSSLFHPNPRADEVSRAISDNPNKALPIEGVYNQWIESKDQPILGKKGDDLRIDWGRLYVAAPSESIGAIWSVGNRDTYQRVFAENLERIQIQSASQPSPAEPIVAPIFFRAFKVSTRPISRWLMLAYDDEFSIQYFKKNLRPYWRRNGDDAAALLKKSAAEYESLKKRCEQFDARLMSDLRKAGGEEYARICALAYRQCVAANKVVADDNGQPLMFPKENFSNGCIGTVDVIYPMSPQFLLFNPSLAKAMLVPILDYAASPRWRWPFAPHDLGTYPLANGQVYGGGERTEQNQMPVEETGNILVMLAALARVEGNADFCAKYWPVLEKWAEYLKAKGFDPENQLCTDDFAGHLAHNVNLSAKAICGLASFARLCEMRGDKAKAAEYQKLAKEFAAKWVKEANDGDHFRLAFDKPGTWSQKYNATWDRVLGFGLWPAATWRSEMDFYKAHQNKYGLPLDSRKDYTKLDWTLWTATLTQKRADFDALVAPVYRFLNESPSRIPMTDWFDTKTGRKTGFQARSVVGGVFLQMLYDRSTWSKWARRDTTKAAGWAPLPNPPKVTVVVPAADKSPATWRFTTDKPVDDWFKPGFDDSAWTEGQSGFGTARTSGAVIGTTWNTPDIWLRREIQLPDGQWHDLQVWLHHDDDAEVYINGVPALRASGNITGYEPFPMTPQGRAALNPGKNLIAVHCHQIRGGQYIDVGLVDVQPQ